MIIAVLFNPSYAVIQHFTEDKGTGASTTSLGNLFQCLTTPTVKDFSLNPSEDTEASNQLSHVLKKTT